jgi:hypothetical protein
MLAFWRQKYAGYKQRNLQKFREGASQIQYFVKRGLIHNEWVYINMQGIEINFQVINSYIVPFYPSVESNESFFLRIIFNYVLL